MPARLLISTDEGVALEVRLQGLPVTLGRAEANTVRSLDRRTSRFHAVVRPAGDSGYELVDAGSSYGTLLNGQPISAGAAPSAAPGAGEHLAHKDRIQCGGLLVQFIEEEDFAPGDDDTQELAVPTDAAELRQQVRHLIEENAALRRELGQVQESEQRARARHEEAHDEAARLREVVAGLRKEQDELRERVAALGNDLRNERSARALLAAQSAAGGAAAAQRQDARVGELEEQNAQLALGEQQLKKEVERLTEVLKKRDKREAELTQVVKPALQRVAQLQDELAQAHAALEALRGKPR